MTDATDDEAAPKANGRAISDATRQARSRALAGQSPRARGLRKALEGLWWIANWGWSSSRILNALVGTQGGNSLGARFVKNGWARRHALRVVGDYVSVPTDVITLTDAGYAQLAALSGRDYDVRVAPRGPAKQMLVHDAQAQMLTLLHMGRLGAPLPTDFARAFGPVTTFKPGTSVGLVGRDSKRPDVTWTIAAKDDDGSQIDIDVEVERSPKWDRELDQFIARHVARQMADENGEYSTDLLMVFFTSSSARARYAEAMKPGGRVRKWFWGSHGKKWEPGEDNVSHHWVEIPADFHARCLMMPEGI